MNKTKRQMKITIFLLSFISLIFSQELNLVVVDNFNAGSSNARVIIDTLLSRTEKSKPDLIVFNGLQPEDKDDNYFNVLKSETFFLPHKNEFNWIKSSRNNFLQNFGDYNFHFTKDSLSIIGLNCSVFWNDKSHLGKEELLFTEAELDGIPVENKIILVLPDNPGDIQNIDELLVLFNGRRIHSIISPIESRTVPTSYNGINIVQPKEYKNEDTIFREVFVNKDTTEVNQFFLGSESEQVASVVEHTSRFNSSFDDMVFDPDSLIIWKKEIDASLIGSLVFSEDKIFSADQSGRVLCLDTLGNELWEYFSFGNIYSTPVYQDGFVAVASIQGDLETIDANNGEALQSIGFNSPVTSNLAALNYKGRQNLMIPKQTNSNAAIIACTENGTVYCYDLETLQEYWHFDSPQGLIQGTPFIQNNQIIFYSGDGIIYSVDGSNGWLVWKGKTYKDNERAFPLASDFVSNDNDIFISIPNNKLYSIETLLGTINWSHSKYNTWTSLGIANKGNIVFAKSADNRFHFLSARQGTWVRELYPKLGKEKTKTDIIEIGNSVYFGLEDGYLVRINNQRNAEKILKLDSSPLYYIKQITDNKLLISTRNGTIAVIKIR